MTIPYHPESSFDNEENYNPIGILNMQFLEIFIHASKPVSMDVS